MSKKESMFGETIIKFDGIKAKGIVKFYNIKEKGGKYYPWGGGCGLGEGFDTIQECKDFISQYIKDLLEIRIEETEKDLYTQRDLLGMIEDEADWLDLFRVKEFEHDKEESS